jgi:ADP-heptose:LPS heptosyltransferase
LPTLRHSGNLIEALSQRRFDAAIIFTSFLQSPYPPAYVCYLAGITVRAGQSQEFGGSLLTHWVRPLPDRTHQVDRNLFLLESLGVEIAGRHLEVRLREGFFCKKRREARRPMFRRALSACFR